MATTNAERWHRALFTRSTDINAAAVKIEANRARYEVVSKATGVPWDVIGVIHYRESSGPFITVAVKQARPYRRLLAITNPSEVPPIIIKPHNRLACEAGGEIHFASASHHFPTT